MSWLVVLPWDGDSEGEAYRFTSEQEARAALKEERALRGWQGAVLVDEARVQEGDPPDGSGKVLPGLA